MPMGQEVFLLGELCQIPNLSLKLKSCRTNKLIVGQCESSENEVKNQVAIDEAKNGGTASSSTD